MDSCRFCSWRLGKHHQACPESSGDNTLWELGYTDGAQRREESSQDPTYSLGYVAGNCALEEAENGFNPAIEGRQW